jgi:hypothetical protein
MKTERVCDKAAGAARNSRIVTEAAPNMRDLRTHMEIETDQGGKTRTVVQDMRKTMVGVCPADLKSGQMRKSNGEVIDFGGRFPVRARPAPSKPKP